MKNGTLSNMGYKVAMSEIVVDQATGEFSIAVPTKADLLNGWESKTGSGWSVNLKDANTVDGEGYSKKVGILKTGKDITLKFLKEDAATFTRLMEQFHGVETSSDAFYVGLTFWAPKRTGWAAVKPYQQIAQLTDFSEGDATTDNIQEYSVTFTPSGPPLDYTGAVPTV